MQKTFLENIGNSGQMFRSSHIFGFWYFGHLSCIIFFLFFLSWPSCLAKCKQWLCNIFVFLYLRCQKWPKTKNEKWDERNINVLSLVERKSCCPLRTIPQKQSETQSTVGWCAFCESLFNFWWDRLPSSFLFPFYKGNSRQQI